MTPSLSDAAWKAVFTDGKVQLLLLVTCTFLAGQFTEYPFVAAQLKSPAGAGTSTIAILFALYGFAGVVGSVIAAIVIDRMGGPRTIGVPLVLVIIAWSLGGASVLLAGLGLLIWGSGAGPVVAAQQARLIAANPKAAAATVALNTSVLYAGQAIGTVLGGWTLSSEHADRGRHGWNHADRNHTGRIDHGRTAVCCMSPAVLRLLQTLPWVKRELDLIDLQPHL
jgi:predicted MFS family arabinose efflux permease